MPTAAVGIGPVQIALREAADEIVVHCNFRDKDNVREIPGKRWNQDERFWTVPLSWAALVQLRGIFDERLIVNDRLNELAWQVYEGRVKPCLELRTAPDAPWLDEPKLTPLQRAAVAFMVTATAALEADPMGAGKTPMTILALKHLTDPFPALVVCPNGVKPHWRDEFATWYPEVDVALSMGDKKHRLEAIEKVESGEAQVLVINWESLIKHTRLAGYGSIHLSDKEKELKELNHIPWRSVVADEAHRAKEPKAKQTRGLWWVGKNAAYRYALTGTPIANSLDDLWSVMHFVEPREYPSKVAFIDRYALTQFNPFGFPDVIGVRGDTREELTKFLDTRFIRRPKKIILPELPGNLPPQKRLVDLKPKQRKVYKQFAKELIVQLDGGTLMQTESINVFQRLRQLCAATGAIDDDGNFYLTEPSAKLDELVEVLDELGDENAAVFAESQQLIELADQRLTNLGVSCAMYTGKQGEGEREANRVGFQEGRIRILLLTYGAGAEGVNLSNASTIIKLERSTSMVMDTQADDRAARPGQKYPTRHIHIFAANTVDWRAEEIVDGKVQMAEEICRDEETLRRMLNE